MHGNHDEIRKILEDLNIEAVDGILLDLGVSSYQIDNKERGFSYMQEVAPLDMRMDKTSNITANLVVNTYSEEKLAEIIDMYGEEKFAKKIARNICEVRKKSEIKTSGELVEIIRKSIPAKFQNRRTSG